jgi:hypothetical protein
MTAGTNMTFSKESNLCVIALFTSHIHLTLGNTSLTMRRSLCVVETVLEWYIVYIEKDSQFYPIVLYLTRWGKKV